MFHVHTYKTAAIRAAAISPKHPKIMLVDAAGGLPLRVTVNLHR